MSLGDHDIHPGVHNLKNSHNFLITLALFYAVMQFLKKFSPANEGFIQYQHFTCVPQQFLNLSITA